MEKGVPSTSSWQPGCLPLAMIEVSILAKAVFRRAFVKIQFFYSICSVEERKQQIFLKDGKFFY